MIKRMKKKQTLLLEHYSGGDNINFNEFEQLNNSGQKR